MWFRTKLLGNNQRVDCRCSETSLADEGKATSPPDVIASLAGQVGVSSFEKVREEVEMTANINPASSRRTVLVTGAQGVSGRAVVEHYSKLPETMVYGLSRRELAGEGNVKHISVDLLNANDIQAKLSPIQGITHLFFGAYIDKQDAAEKSAINVQLLTLKNEIVFAVFGSNP